jgi:transposase-like protein
MSASTWPSTPLDAAEKAFTMLAEAPTHVPFDLRGFDGLPDRIVPLDELRKFLLAAGTSNEVRDAVWRELVIRARRDGPAWRVAAVGMAMPGLRRQAGLLASGWYGDTHDLDSELVLGFMERLATLDLAEPRICGRLVDAGVRAARKLRDADSDTVLIRTGEAGSLLPIRPWDHPDLVLARAVATAVLDRDEARLIAATRLDNSTLASVAGEIGISPQTASDWRAKAEQRLRRAIAAGELAFVPLRSRRQRPNSSGRARRVGSALGAPAAAQAALGTQQKALVGKASDRRGSGVRAPGIAATPA